MSNDNCYPIHNKPIEWVEAFFKLVSVLIAADEVEFDDTIDHKR
ncbi:hypothetical protein V7139_21405 [Neobacillus drentensis]